MTDKRFHSQKFSHQQRSAYTPVLVFDIGKKENRMGSFFISLSCSFPPPSGTSFLLCCTPLIQLNFDRAGFSVSQSAVHCFSSACHHCVMHMVTSGLCSFLTVLLWTREQLMRLQSLLLSPNVLKSWSSGTHLLVHIWACCSLLCLLKKKFHGHDYVRTPRAPWIFLPWLYFILFEESSFLEFLIVLDACNVWMQLSLLWSCFSLF